MAASGKTPVLGGKKCVEICMHVEVWKNGTRDGDAGNKYEEGINVMFIRCLNCVKIRKTRVMEWTIPVANGYGNAWTHYVSCVGGTEQAAENYHRLKSEKEEEERRLHENGEDDDDTDTVPRSQSQLTGFLPTAEVQSIFMWLRLITMKNMPIKDVECEIMRASVKYPKVRSSKTVMDTGHYLVERVEKKIAAMMKKAPLGQLLFDGYTLDGLHLVAVFASFMVPYKGKESG